MSNGIFQPDFSKDILRKMVGTLAVLAVAGMVTWATGILSDRFTSTDAAVRFDQVHKTLIRLEALIVAHQQIDAHGGQAIAQARNDVKLETISENQRRILTELAALKSQLIGFKTEDGWPEK